MRLASAAAAYVVLIVCALTISPSTPWVVVIFLAVSVLNRYVTYCVVWRAVRDTGATARPSPLVKAVVVGNLTVSLAVIVQWLVRASGASVGDVFPVGAACVTVATCCWVGRAACQLMFGVHRWSWSPADMDYPWTHITSDVDDDEAEGDTKPTGLSDNPLSGYLLSQCNDVADEYYRQTTELMDTVHNARDTLTDDAPVEEKVMSVYTVAATASRRRDIAADGVRLSEHLRGQEPNVETAIDEPWNSPGADALIAEAWDLAAGDSAGESPVLDWLVGHVDELLNDGSGATESAPYAVPSPRTDRLDPQDNDS